MKIRMRLVALESLGHPEGFSTELIRFSADHGELLAKSVYSSPNITVQVLALLVAENEREREVLARYAASGEVPDAARVAMQVVSLSVADAIATARKKLTE